MMLRILFIDDDPNIHTILRHLLPKECELISATRGDAGLKLCTEERPDLVLLDIGLPDIDGMLILREIVGQVDAPPVVILSIYSESNKIVEAMKLGAANYIVKPISTKNVIALVKTALRFRTHEAPIGSDLMDEIVGESPRIVRVKRLIARFAEAELPVLITGETGTGKELVAEAIHRLSPRCEGRFLPMNCGAIPESLVETELFGAVAGAYTGAVTRSGLFEQASGGTLFLDEIGEMNRSAQVKLLRVLEDKHVTRVGATTRIPVNVRVVSATNRCLKEAVGRGEFRADLYYRINTLPLDLPPLRERKEDLSLLAKKLLSDGKGETRITIAALEKLERYDWPGNIRELKNVVERARLYAGTEPIGPQHITFS